MISVRPIYRNRTRKPSDVEVVIAGGGTGGHVYPAMAIAEALVEQEGVPKHGIWFVGSKRGLEARVIPAAGYHIELLAGRGIVRRISWAAVRATLSLLQGAVQALRLIARHRPRVIVSVGGYAAAPCCIGAVLFRVPLVLAEANAVPGAVHRIFSRFAYASAISWPNTALPRAELTGNPVRGAVRSLTESQRGELRANTRKALGIGDDRVVIAVIGGSLGARRINDAVRSLREMWVDRDNVAIYHVVGDRDWDHYPNGIDNQTPLWFRAVRYQDDMAELYAASDILICRAGATTCAEVAIVGIPSVIVPLPNTPGDHQVANAQALVNTGGAVMLRDENCTGEQLASVLKPLIESADRRHDMQKSLLTLGKPRAAECVAAIVTRAKETAS